MIDESTIEREARNTFKKICDNLPYNTNRMYCELFLESSRCKIYMPVRNNLIANASAAKEFWEKVANAAKL